MGAQGNSPPGLGTDQRARLSRTQRNAISPEPVPALKKPFAPSRSHTGQSREFPGATGRRLFAYFFQKKYDPSLVGTSKRNREGGYPSPASRELPSAEGSQGRKGVQSLPSAKERQYQPPE